MNGSAIAAARQEVAVIAVGVDHGVVVVERRDRADRHRFLADVEVA